MEAGNRSGRFLAGKQDGNAASSKGARQRAVAGESFGPKDTVPGKTIDIVAICLRTRVQQGQQGLALRFGEGMVAVVQQDGVRRRNGQWFTGIEAAA